MIDATIDAMIKTAADTHGLPAGLVAAITCVESAGIPWAYRFEPRFLSMYVSQSPERFGQTSVLSERHGRATSWGLMQIMGQVARERGCVLPYLTALCAPDAGLEWGCRHLSALAKRHRSRWGWDGVIAAYNAGAPRRALNRDFENQHYVDRVKSYWGDINAA